MLLTYQFPLLVALAALLWLALGGVLVGPHYPVIRRRLADGTGAGGDALDRLAEASFSARNRWNSALLRVIQAIAARFVKPAPNSATPADPPRDLPPIVLACFSAVLLAAACATNYALLSDLLPDLAGVAPSDRVFPRLGWWIAITSPAVIIGGEAIGGLMGIRYSAGRQLFFGCLVFEILAALRRAADYAFESSFDAGQPVQISPIGAVQGATFVALAVLLPIVIYKTGAVLEPALRALSGLAAFKAAGRALGVILKNLPLAFAIVGLVIAVVVVAIGLTVIALLFAAAAWVVRHVVHLILSTVLAIVVGLPVFVVGRVQEIFRRQPRVTTAAMLAALMPMIAGCGNPRTDVAASPMTFDTIAPSEMASPLAPVDVLAIPSHRLIPELVRLSPVKKVKEPALFVCVVDATGSVPAAQRDRMLRSCAHRVALAPPETTGAVVLVGAAGWSSAMPVVWRRPRVVVTRCQADPPVPDVDGPTMSYERAMRRARAHIDELTKQCNAAVTGDRDGATQNIADAETAFVNQVLTSLNRRLYHVTDLFGTLGRMKDLERATKDEQGPLVRIDIELLSDLIDSANGCALNEKDSGTVEFVCAGSAVGAAHAFLARPEVHARFFQVVSSEPSMRLTSEQWRTFWSSFAPRITVTTWSQFSLHASAR